MALSGTTTPCRHGASADDARRFSVRPIAFYLPQFHPIPENNLWWGEGFTEWTNVRKAEPLFPGHDQPRYPSELGYYNLLDPQVRAAQAGLAREYGVSAFCYYHYWFAGKRLLERPFEAVLRTGEPDFPFCLCWANESWTGVWHGAPDRLLIEQTYPGEADHKAHFKTLLPAFKDERYLRVNGCPLFLVYMPFKIPDLRAFASLWQNLAQEAGLKGLYLVGMRTWKSRWNPKLHRFQAAATMRVPPYPSPGMLPRRVPAGEDRVIVYDHERVVERLISLEKTPFRDFPVIAPNWDNTPRCGTRGIVLHGSRPELFRRNIEQAVSRSACFPESERLLFIKAWNEWAEGNYLEPDQSFGRGYLETLRQALEESDIP